MCWLYIQINLMSPCWIKSINIYWNHWNLWVIPNFWRLVCKYQHVVHCFHHFIYGKLYGCSYSIDNYENILNETQQYYYINKYKILHIEVKKRLFPLKCKNSDNNYKGTKLSHIIKNLSGNLLSHHSYKNNAAVQHLVKGQ